MKQLLIILIVLSVSKYGLYAQSKTITGKVISNHFETVPGVFIFINDTVKIGQTDLDGFFRVVVPKSVKKILFDFVGVYPSIIELPDTCDEIELVMMSHYTYDFLTLKKAERMRMKVFKRLPQLHKEAFDKGIFKTSKACYIQDFVPYYMR